MAFTLGRFLGNLPCYALLVDLSFCFVGVLIVWSFELSSLQEGLYCTRDFADFFVDMSVAISRDRAFFTRI